MSLEEISPFITDLTNPDYVNKIFRTTRRNIHEFDYYNFKIDLNNWIEHKEEILKPRELTQSIAAAAPRRKIDPEFLEQQKLKLKGRI